MNSFYKKTLLTIILFAVFGTIGGLFWYQEIQYLKPTPVPSDYVNVPVGSSISLDFLENNGKAKFFHFYNTNCPCSRFNLQKYKKLIHSDGKELDAYFVIKTSKDELSNDLIDLLSTEGVNIIEDQSEIIAKSLGVYSTPQIALLDQELTLFYRGNYNKARYCTSKKTDYARIALDSVLSGKESPSFSAWATKSYGCSLEK